MTVRGGGSASLRPASVEDAGDAGTFLHRVTRLDPDAQVRLRRAAGAVELWAWLPLEVLVSRRVDGALDDPDRTVRAADLLAGLSQACQPDRGGALTIPLPAADHGPLFGALPPRTGWRRVDRVPASEVERLVRAGTETFRTAAATAANANRVGAALLDHEAIIVSDDVEAVRVPLRMPQALARMGFLPPAVGGVPAAVIVSVTATWARFDAAYGVAYLRRTPGLSLIPL